MIVVDCLKSIHLYLFGQKQTHETMGTLSEIKIKFKNAYLISKHVLFFCINFWSAFYFHFRHSLCIRHGMIQETFQRKSCIVFYDTPIAIATKKNKTRLFLKWRKFQQTVSIKNFTFSGNWKWKAKTFNNQKLLRFLFLNYKLFEMAS